MPDHHVVELLDGSRVTTVARTIFDLGGVLDEEGHRSLVDDARNKRLCTDAEIGEVYADLCGRGRRGSAAWRRVADLAERRGRPTMSELELLLHDGLVAAGLGSAVQQHEVVLPSGRVARLDLAHPAELVDVEVDHAAWHATVSSVESDKTRDLGLTAMGWAPLRFTDRMLEHRLAMCVEVVRSVLDRRRAALPSTG